MANINDLESIQEDPKTVNEWLGNFDDNERETVVSAMLTHQPHKVYPILKTLDNNPFPFTRGALSNYVNKVKNGEN